EATVAVETKEGLALDGCRGCSGDSRWSGQGYYDADLQEGRDRRIASPAGPCRLLGAMVWTMQAARADSGKGGARRQRRGQAGQDEYRRAPGCGGVGGVHVSAS